MEAGERRDIRINFNAPVNIFEAMKAEKSGMQATIKEVIPHQIINTVLEEGIKNEYRFSVRYSF
jgi:hypothetical protein